MMSLRGAPAATKQSPRYEETASHSLRSARSDKCFLDGP